MIHQSHRDFLWHARTSKAVDVGDAKAVKTEMWLSNFDEELLPPPRGLEWELQRAFVLRAFQTTEQGA